jgi:uncharacterized membrane protein
MTSYSLQPCRREEGHPWSRRPISLIALAVVYGLAGGLHLTVPGPFISIVPGWVPAPATVVRLTGLCELAGAVGLIMPRTRRLAGFMLALYAVCVFPANINQAFWLAGPHPSPWRWLYHAPRLSLQPVIIWWPLWASGLVDWPFRRSAHQLVKAERYSAPQGEVGPKR